MGRKNHTNCFWPNSLKNNKGFTLSEVIVSITIVAILAIMGYQGLKPAVQLAKGRDGRRKADLNLISNSLENYAGDHPCYPEEALLSNCSPGIGLKPYLNKIPCDPLTGLPYAYVRPECKQFVVYASLETQTTEDYGDRRNYAISSSNLRVIPTLVGGATSTPGQPVATNTPAPTIPPGPTVTPSPTPIIPSGYYGCFSGRCEELTVGEKCEPKYQTSDCLENCLLNGEPISECIVH